MNKEFAIYCNSLNFSVAKHFEDLYLYKICFVFFPDTLQSICSLYFFSEDVQYVYVVFSEESFKTLILKHAMHSSVLFYHANIFKFAFTFSHVLQGSETSVDGLPNLNSNEQNFKEVFIMNSSYPFVPNQSHWGFPRGSTIHDIQF